MVRSRNAFLGALALAAMSYSGIAAQESSHQRLSVEGRESLEVTVGTSCALTKTSDSSGSGLALDPSLSLDLLAWRRLGLSIDLPFAAWVDTRREALPRAVGALGDPSVAATYTFRLADWRLGSELSYSHPLGVWEEHESATKLIASGSGYPTLGAAISAIRYLDPLVAGLRIEAETCLPRSERWGSSMIPLALKLNLFATEALNDIAALSAGLSQRLAWPRLYEGIPEESGLSYSMSGNVGLIFSSRSDSLRVALSRPLSSASAPASLELGYSHTFRNKEPRDAR